MSITPVPISIRLVRAADGSQERERRCLLPGEVVHPHVGTVDTQLLGGHRELDALHQGVPPGPHLGPGNGLPVTEGQEPDSLAHVIRARRRGHLFPQTTKAPPETGEGLGSRYCYFFDFAKELTHSPWFLYVVG